MKTRGMINVINVRQVLKVSMKERNATAHYQEKPCIVCDRFYLGLDQDYLEGKEDG